MFSSMSSIVLISIIGFVLFEGINEVHCNECYDALNLEFKNEVKPKLEEIFKPINTINVFDKPEIKNDARSWFKYFITFGGLKNYQNTQFIFQYALYVGLIAVTDDIWQREKFCTIIHGQWYNTNKQRRYPTKRIVTENGMMYDYKFGREVTTEEIKNEMDTEDDIILPVVRSREICHNDLNKIGIDILTPPTIIFNILYNLDYDIIEVATTIQNYIDHAFGVTKLVNVLDPENFCTNYDSLLDSMVNVYEKIKDFDIPFSLLQIYGQNIKALVRFPVSRDGDVGSSSMHRNIE